MEQGRTILGENNRMRYTVIQDKSGSYTIQGLPAYLDGDNVILLMATGEGDYKDPETKGEMHKALYDEYQTNDNLSDGDEFDTPFGEFYCKGVHVFERGYPEGD